MKLACTGLFFCLVSSVSGCWNFPLSERSADAADDPDETGTPQTTDPSGRESTWEDTGTAAEPPETGTDTYGKIQSTDSASETESESGDTGTSVDADADSDTDSFPNGDTDTDTDSDSDSASGVRTDEATDSDTDTATARDTESDTGTGTAGDTDRDTGAGTDTPRDTGSEVETESDSESQTNPRDTGSAPSPDCAELVVESAGQVAAMYAGTTLQLRAKCTIDGQSVDVTDRVTWTSSSPIAGVSNLAGTEGLVTAVAPGWAMLTADYDDPSGLPVISPPFYLTVLANRLTTISIKPTTAIITASGGTQQFTATCRYLDTSERDCTDDVLWSVWNGAVATIDTEGLATAAGNGQTTISASLDGVNSYVNAVLTVSAGTICTSLTIGVGGRTTMIENTTLQATAICDFNTSDTGVDVTASSIWLSSNEDAAVVSATGEILAQAVDVPLGTEISATFANPESSVVSSNTLPITVVPRTLTTITVTPADDTITDFDDTVQYTARCLYDNGQNEACTADVTWTSSNTEVAAISATGLASAVTNGETTITAAWGDVTSSGDNTLTVSLGAICTALTISTGGITTLVEGTSVQATALCALDTGTPDANVTTSSKWLSSNPDAAVVSATGEILAQPVTSELSTVIVATYDNPDDSIQTSNAVELTVTPRVLTGIAVAPESGTISSIDETIQYTALCEYNNGDTEDCTSSASWSTSDPDVATVEAGLANPVSNGTIGISASLNSVGSNVASLTVVLGAICEVLTIEGPDTVPVGATAQLHAVCEMDDSTEEDVTGMATWTSDSPSAASVDSGGLLTGKSLGAAAVIAAEYANPNHTTGRGTHDVIVTAPILVRVDVSPETPEALPVGLTQAFTALCTYSDASSGDCTDDLTWSSDDEKVAAFVASTAGTVIGVAPGDAGITATSGEVSSLSVRLTVIATPDGGLP